ncbi:hypothetical protein KI387_027098, partial [Taxus chinensis]
LGKVGVGTYIGGGMGRWRWRGGRWRGIADSHPIGIGTGLTGPVGHSVGRGYGSTEPVVSSAGENYYTVGQGSCIGIAPRAESGHGIDIGHKVDSGIGSHGTGIHTSRGTHSTCTDSDH